MKNVTSVAVILFVLLAASCKKENNTALNAWAFKNLSYSADSSSYNSTGGGAVFANGKGSELVVYFPNGLPSATTTYTVANGDTTIPLAHVYIGLRTTSASYYSTGGNGFNQTVTVTVASGGKISLSGNNIEVINTTIPADSSSVSFNFNLFR